MESKDNTIPNYSDEFKSAAVAKYLKIGASRTCRELGIASSTLYKWKEKFNPKVKSNPENKPSYEDLEKENQKLKKELGYISEINNILKKSTAIFSNSEMGGLK